MGSIGGSTFIITIFFLLIFISGYWLSRTGKPYSSLMITVHKLIGLATGIYLAISVYQLHQVVQPSPVGIFAVCITVLLFIGLVCTGGLLRSEKPIPGALSSMHKFFPYLTLVSTTLMIFPVSFGR